MVGTSLLAWPDLERSKEELSLKFQGLGRHGSQFCTFQSGKPEDCLALCHTATGYVGHCSIGKSAEVAEITGGDYEKNRLTATHFCGHTWVVGKQFYAPLPSGNVCFRTLKAHFTLPEAKHCSRADSSLGEEFKTYLLILAWKDGSFIFFPSTKNV